MQRDKLDQKTLRDLFNKNRHTRALEDSASSSLSPVQPSTETNQDKVETPFSQVLPDSAEHKAAKAGLAPKGPHDQEPKLKVETPKDHSQALSHRQKALVAEGYDQIPNEAFAGFWVRLLAYTVDWVIIQFISQILFNLLAIEQIDLANGLIPKLTSLFIYCLYFTLATGLLKGQTPGKILFNLRVVPLNSDQDRLPFSTLIIREFFGRIVCYYVPWLMVILVFTNRKQHPVDILSDTSVINEKYLQAFAKWQTA